MKSVLKAIATLMLFTLPPLLTVGYIATHPPGAASASPHQLASFSDPANRSIVFIRVEGNDGYFACSGFLAYQTSAATAAHCFQGHQPNGEVKVYFGFVSPTKFRASCDGAPHISPEYVPGDYKWDFALVNLYNCTTLDGKPIAVPTWGKPFKLSSDLNGDEFTVTGFPGDTESLTTSTGHRVSSCLVPTPLCFAERWGIRTSAYAIPGVSGSPLLNDSHAVGILVAATGDTTLSRHLDSTVLERFDVWHNVATP